MKQWNSWSFICPQKLFERMYFMWSKSGDCLIRLSDTVQKQMPVVQRALQAFVHTSTAILNSSWQLSAAHTPCHLTRLKKIHSSLWQLSITHTQPFIPSVCKKRKQKHFRVSCACVCVSSESWQPALCNEMMVERAESFHSGPLKYPGDSTCRAKIRCDPILLSTLN